MSMYSKDEHIDRVDGVPDPLTGPPTPPRSHPEPEPRTLVAVGTYSQPSQNPSNSANSSPSLPRAVKFCIDFRNHLTRIDEWCKIEITEENAQDLCQDRACDLHQLDSLKTRASIGFNTLRKSFDCLDDKQKRNVEKWKYNESAIETEAERMREAIKDKLENIAEFQRMPRA